MPEYFDIIDEQGNKTGETKLRTLVHKDGDWHKTVHIWIVNSKNEILLQQRNSIKDKNPNMWDISSAGHISAGGESLDSAQRELEEELGLKVNAEDLQFLFSIKSSDKIADFIDNEISDIYLLRRDIDPTKLTLQEEEVAAVKFTTADAIRKRLAENDPSLIRHDEEYARLFEVLGV